MHFAVLCINTGQKMAETDGKRTETRFLNALPIRLGPCVTRARLQITKPIRSSLYVTTARPKIAMPIRLDTRLTSASAEARNNPFKRVLDQLNRQFIFDIRIGERPLGVGNTASIGRAANEPCKSDIQDEKRALDVGDAATVPRRANKCCRSDIRGEEPGAAGPRMSETRQRFPCNQTNAANPTSRAANRIQMSEMQRRLAARQTNLANPTYRTKNMRWMSETQQRCRAEQTGAAKTTSAEKGTGAAGPWMSELQQRFRRKQTGAANPTSEETSTEKRSLQALATAALATDRPPAAPRPTAAARLRRAPTARAAAPAADGHFSFPSTPPDTHHTEPCYGPSPLSSSPTPAGVPKVIEAFH